MSKLKSKFKIGDIVTVFDISKCISAGNERGHYYFGGKNQFGKSGEIVNINSDDEIGKLSKKKCFILVVKFEDEDYTYVMLEDEFEEYYKDSPETTSKQDLLDSQRLWIKHRNATCDIYPKIANGTMFTLLSNECYLSEVKNRAEYLEYLINISE